MKKYIKIVLLFSLFVGVFVTVPFSLASENLDITTINNTGDHTNDILDDMLVGDTDSFLTSKVGEDGFYAFLLRIARDAKNLFYFIATIYFLILVFKLLASGKSEEELGNFKKGIIWISVGMAVMQLSYSFVKILFNQDVEEELANKLMVEIMEPLINLLETGASFFFIAMAIYSFYRLVTAYGNEEAVKTGKMTIVYSIVGYIVIKLTKTLVEVIYGELNCTGGPGLDCIETVPDVAGFSGILTNIINWSNGFIGVLTIVMIIYAGYNILFSGGNEEMLKKAKSTILYIIIGLFLLVTNYLILTFFLIPSNAI